MDIWKEVESLAVNFDACHKTLTAMGDETRQHTILEMMRMDYNGSRVIDIAATTNLSRPAVSHHLQILKDAGIVKMRKEGKMGHCDWVFASEKDRFYHDHEWGIPVHDDRRMFEHLTLECLQCGLSWGLMMKKREIFRQCFENFEYDKIATYGEDDIQRILNTEGMLKSERKVRAVINNAKCYLKIRAEFGSFCAYLWAFTGGETVLYEGHADGAIPVSNDLSDKISRDLKKRGFKFVGAVTIYSHLQACGIINDHAADCPCYKKIIETYPTVKMVPDREVGQAGG